MDPHIPKVEPRPRVEITEDMLDETSPSVPVLSSALPPAPPPAFSADPSGASLPKRFAPPEAPASSTFCRACGRHLDSRAVMCPGCGVATGINPLQASPSVAMAAMTLNRKSPGVAIVLSLLFTGAGQWYCGRIGRGFAFLTAAIIGGLLMLAVVGFLILPVVYAWAAIDANKLANEHNARLMTEVTGVAG